MTTPTQATKDRTTDFMHALAADVDAVNISAGPTGCGMMVHAWLRPTSDVKHAAELTAREHGFELYGEIGTDLNAKYNQAAADAGRKRFRFETQTQEDE